MRLRQEIGRAAFVPALALLSHVLLKSHLPSTQAPGQIRQNRWQTSLLHECPIRGIGETMASRPRPVKCMTEPVGMWLCVCVCVCVCVYTWEPKHTWL